MYPCMKSIPLITGLVLAAFTLSLRAAATDNPNADDDTQADKSGTNPLNFQNTLSFKNEFNRIGDNYANFTRFNYSHPLAPNLKVGLDLPLLASDATGHDKFGLGDIAVKTTWIPYATSRWDSRWEPT
jgi:hypothetical protein